MSTQSHICLPKKEQTNIFLQVQAEPVASESLKQSCQINPKTSN